jgi:glyoxylate/hydroxypyruvate reductase A
MKPPCVALVSEMLDMWYLVPAFKACHPDIDLRLGPDFGRLDEIDVAVCWSPPDGLLAMMPNLRLIQSLGAGADHILKDDELPDKPVCRIIDPDMTTGMSAYIAWAVINQQRRFPTYCAQSVTGVWKIDTITMPSRHRVGIAGMGRLGEAAAKALLAIGYTVHGWSRAPKPSCIPGVTYFHGDAERDAFLAQTDTLVCLLPLTAQTTGFLDRDVFAALPQGAHVINVGRGLHLVEADLLDALASGHLSAATLDTTIVEPLPPAHPFWGHERILVTPHIATRTAPATIARQTLDNDRLLCEGQTPAGQVDTHHGY